MIIETLAVACGGALGATLRYYVSVSIHSKLGVAFPYGTLTVNMAGCLLLGLTAAFCLRHPEMPLPNKAIFNYRSFGRPYYLFNFQPRNF